jgi:hypothetical protein
MAAPFELRPSRALIAAADSTPAISKLATATFARFVRIAIPIY